MDPHDRPRTVTLDSAQLRVLAHPLRARLLGALRLYGPATSTGLAQRLETNSGATSYHLRKLAEVGLVEEDTGRGVRRERYWQAAHEITSWVETEFAEDPDDRAAADWLLSQHTLLKSRWLTDWFTERHEWPTEWRNAADNSDFLLELSAQQLAAMRDEIHGVINRYLDAESEPDAERVTVLLDAFPSPEPRL